MGDRLTWGHVRQTVLLQGKVPGGWFEGFWGKLLLTSKSFRFFARLKAFSGGLLKILVVVLSSWRIRKFLEMILTATRFLGWKVVTNGTLSIAVLFARTLFKISTLDLVDARSLPFLMTPSGYPRDAKKVSRSCRLDVNIYFRIVRLIQKYRTLKQPIRYLHKQFFHLIIRKNGLKYNGILPGK